MLNVLDLQSQSLIVHELPKKQRKNARKETKGRRKKNDKAGIYAKTCRTSRVFSGYGKYMRHPVTWPIGRQEKLGRASDFLGAPGGKLGFWGVEGFVYTLHMYIYNYALWETRGLASGCFMV